MRRLYAFAGLALLAVVATAGAGGPAAQAAAGAAPTLRWTTVHPGAVPPPLSYAAAAYDPDTVPPTVVMFGGRRADGSLSADTWTWDGSTWTDHPAAATSAPPARELAAMAFDSALHQLVLFGGQGAGGGLLADTWAWNGASWFKLGADQSGSQPSGPPAREAAAMAFDPGGSLLLFGGTGYAVSPTASSTSVPGVGSNGTPATEKVLGDGWRWDGKAWSQVTARGPAPRSGAALAYDPAARVAVLFGGESTPADSAAPGLLSDTWTWDGRAWSAVPTAGTTTPTASPTTTPAAARSTPPARFDAVFEYSAPLAAPVLMCGSGSAGALADAWVWAGGRWTEGRLQGDPSPRVGAAAGADAARGATVIFGGTGAGGRTLGDTAVVAEVSTSTAPPSTTSTTRPGTQRVAPPPARGASKPPATVPSHPPTSRRAAKPATSGPAPAPGGAAGSLTGGPWLTASATTARRGSVVRLSGHGFRPGSAITLTFHSRSVLMGRVDADAHGAFTLPVAVPPAAAPGEHHFVAAGTAPSGAQVAPSAAVMVTVPPAHGASTVVKVALLALALLIPVGAWLAMVLAARWRGRPGPLRAPGTAPRSPS